MSTGLLEQTDTVRLSLGPNKEILEAPDIVFHTENQAESRTMIYESEYILEYLGELSSLLSLGEPSFVTVTEPGRQTSFRYGAHGADCIVLTREHRSVAKIIQAFDESGS